MSEFNSNDNFNNTNTPQGKKPRRNLAWLWATLVLIAFVGGVLLAEGINRDKSVQPQATQQSGIENKTQEPQATPSTTASAQPEATYNPVNESISKAYASVSDVVSDVASAVVGISNNVTTFQGGGSNSLQGTEVTQSSGSGVIISADGYIVTNYHVIENADTIRVKLAGGDDVKASLVGGDERTDIALLKVDRDGLNYVTFGDSNSVRVGEFAIAIGNPLGHDLAGTVTFGIISAVNREVTDSEGLTSLMLQTDAAINPGNSGGALINMNGQLIGINTAKSTLSSSLYSTTYAEGIGFAIPSNSIQPIIDELKANGFIARPMLGVGSVSTVTEAQAEYNKVPVGVLIRKVYDGPASRAGIKVMDIITSFNGEEIKTYEQLKAAIDKCSVGQEVEIVVYRMDDSQSHTFTIKLVSQNEINTNAS